MKYILLVGFYGKGNFGDDVLFKVTYNMVLKWQPNAKISVLCDQYLEHYLPKLIKEEIRVIHLGNREHFDVIIHGGGGTFFDFKKYGLVNYSINSFIKMINFSNYQKLDFFIRKITNKKSISASKRYGFGIGIGTYTNSSQKLKYNIPILLDFDSLVVRDASSIKNLKKLGIKKNIKLGSDLAFLDNFWVPSNIKINSSTKGKKRIGLVLRDWDNGNNYLNTINSMFKSLSEIYELSIFVFDKRTDHEVIKISKNLTTYIWDPMTIKFDDYCKKLANQDILITSRAHGAMCGAILGVPSILLEIEPKLKTIHELLPNTTALLNLDKLNLVSIKVLIERMLLCKKIDIYNDAQKNKKLIQDIIYDTLLLDKNYV
jgi:polysaccharide pyruvyl transferase WcaK-like protein